MISSALPVLLTSDRLPSRLADLLEPPAALYLRGELPRGPAVAIVGTRQATVDALRFTRRLAGELAAAGVAVLSGGAVGIDTAAHRGALAARGTTVVVAPAGYSAPYPEENAALFRRIVQRGGAYVALVPDDEPARPAAFFARNACLVALAHAIVVVQAGYRSGARNAAAQARRLGRPLFVVPSSPWVARGQGCLLELRQGALLCERALDVLKLLERIGLHAIPMPNRQKRRRQPAELNPATPSRGQLAPAAGLLPKETNDSSRFNEDNALERVLRVLRIEACYPDELVARAGLPVARAHEVLLTLKLRGVLVANPSGRLELVKFADL